MMDIVLGKELFELASQEKIRGLFYGQRKSTRERDYILLERYVIDYQELQNLDEVIVYAGDGEFRCLRRGEYDARAMALFVNTPEIYQSWEEFVEKIAEAV